MMVLMTSEKTVNLQVPVPESLRTRLKVQALKEGITLRDLANRVLEQALKNLEKEKK